MQNINQQQVVPLIIPRNRIIRAIENINKQFTNKIVERPLIKSGEEFKKFGDNLISIFINRSVNNVEKCLDEIDEWLLTNSINVKSWQEVRLNLRRQNSISQEDIPFIVRKTKHLMKKQFDKRRLLYLGCPIHIDEPIIEICVSPGCISQYKSLCALCRNDHITHTQYLLDIKSHGLTDQQIKYSMQIKYFKESIISTLTELEGLSKQNGNITGLQANCLSQQLAELQQCNNYIDYERQCNQIRLYYQESMSQQIDIFGQMIGEQQNIITQIIKGIGQKLTITPIMVADQQSPRLVEVGQYDAIQNIMKWLYCIIQSSGIVRIDYDINSAISIHTETIVANQITELNNQIATIKLKDYLSQLKQLPSAANSIDQQQLFNIKNTKTWIDDEIVLKKLMNQHNLQDCMQILNKFDSIESEMYQQIINLYKVIFSIRSGRYIDVDFIHNQMNQLMMETKQLLNNYRNSINYQGLKHYNRLSGMMYQMLTQINQLIPISNYSNLAQEYTRLYFNQDTSTNLFQYNQTAMDLYQRFRMSLQYGQLVNNFNLIEPLLRSTKQQLHHQMNGQVIEQLKQLRNNQGAIDQLIQFKQRLQSPDLQLQFEDYIKFIDNKTHVKIKFSKGFQCNEDEEYFIEVLSITNKCQTSLYKQLLLTIHHYFENGSLLNYYKCISKISRNTMKLNIVQQLSQFQQLVGDCNLGIIIQGSIDTLENHIQYYRFNQYISMEHMQYLIQNIAQYQ